MPAEVRYAHSDDLNIAYQVHGTGPVDLLFCIGTYSHLDMLWDLPHWARMFDRLAETSRFILFDKRGSGLSDPVSRIYTLEERIDDMRAVLDAAGSRRAYLLGFSEGGAMALLFAATYPERVAGVILYGAPVCMAWKPDWPYGLKDAELEASIASYREQGFRPNFDGDSWRRWAGAVHDDAVIREWWSKMDRAVGSPAERIAMERMNHLIDVRGILPAVRVPSLVMVREDDPVVSVEESRYGADHLPNARLVVLPGQGHLMFDIWEDCVAAIEEFITGAPRVVGGERFLTTLVSADIVGSTDVIAQRGDAYWREIVTRHYDLVARRLAMYGGVEVDRAGDGLLARFDGPARAIRFARDVDRDDQTIGLRARAAVHTGEVEVVEHGVRGLAVHIVSRLTGLAAAGDVVVSSTVRDLVGGSGFTFVDRGVHELKGVPDARQVFALA